MKNLLFCTQSYITGKGGVASYAHDFVEAFSEQYSISVVTSDIYEKSEKDTIDIYHIHGENFSTENTQSFLALINKIKPDVIVNSSYPLVALLSPYLDNNIKIISVSHFVDGKLAWFAGFNANYTDCVISLSSFGKTYIEHKFHIKDKNKVKVSFNFMPEIAPKYKEKENRKVLKIVYPGGCSYAKSAEVICLALKKMLNTHLSFEFYWLGGTKIAGGDCNSFKTRHVEDCLPKDDRIKQIGPVPREKSKEILADANVFLLPSRGEGFPITLIEAMRSGCIAIISDAHHGSLDAISDGKNGLIVKQGSAKAIVNKVVDIIQHPNKYKPLYAASYQYYKANLTQEVWRHNMQQALEAPTSHDIRSKTFDASRYTKDCNRLNQMIRGFWFRDRLHQLYHFLAFRWIRYCG